MTHAGMKDWRSRAARSRRPSTRKPKRSRRRWPRRTRRSPRLDQHSIRDLVIENVDEPSRELVVRYTFSAPHYARTAGACSCCARAWWARSRKARSISPSASRITSPKDRPGSWTTSRSPCRRTTSPMSCRRPASSKRPRSSIAARRRSRRTRCTTGAHYEVRQYVVTRDKLTELNKTFAEILADERTSAVFK